MTNLKVEEVKSWRALKRPNERLTHEHRRKCSPGARGGNRFQKQAGTRRPASCRPRKRFTLKGSNEEKWRLKTEWRR